MEAQDVEDWLALSESAAEPWEAGAEWRLPSGAVLTFDGVYWSAPEAIENDRAA